MSKKDVNKEAYEQAKKELLEEKVKEVKGYIKETLIAIEEKKKEKAKVEEEMRVLKLDLEDLKKGNFEKIIERKKKSKVARGVGIEMEDTFLGGFDGISVRVTGDNFASNLTGEDFANGSNPAIWETMTAGTYEVGNRSFYVQSSSNVNMSIN